MSVKNSFIQIANIVTGRIFPGRGITVLPSDVFIVSYPKSGNTWTRFLIGNAIYTDVPLDFINVEKLVPDIYLHTDSYLLQIEKPRILKSHEYFHPKYKKVVYIVRDPRDVLVSYYHHLIKCRRIDSSYPLEKFAAQFISGEFDSYGSWYENVAGWIRVKKPGKELLLVRYEDMLADTMRELERIIVFLGIERNFDHISAAINRSSKESMQELERKQADQWETTKGTNLNLPFVREGKAGTWEGYLPVLVTDMIEDAWGDVMQELGYL